MLADVFVDGGGGWKNIIEMEDTLTVDELYLLVEAIHRKESRHNKFMAALNGVDLDKESGESDFERVQIRAQAALAGKSEEHFVLENIIGIDIDEDDDD